VRRGLAEQAASSLRASAEHLLESASRLLPAIAAALVVLVITWGLATLVRRVVRVATGYLENEAQRHLLRQLSFHLVWVLGGLVALEVLGVDARSVVTGLGLGSIALGFALKDILSNLVSGLLILLTHAFKIDDQIVVGETEGTVERIEVHATQIRTYDGRLVLVPNGEIFTGRVTNNTASPHRRASVFVYLNYRQDLQRAASIILTTMSSVPGVATEPAPSMRLRDLTPEHLHIEARFWTDSRRGDFMNTASTVRVAILEALRTEGIDLPNPHERRVMLVEPSAGEPRSAPRIAGQHRREDGVT
jgi:small-conductance mechanosensitive channel